MMPFTPCDPPAPLAAQRSTMVSRGLRSLVAGALAASLAACSSDDKDAATYVSPLVGSWQIKGALPAPGPDLPRFTSLTFTSDGIVEATYVAAAGVPAGIGGEAKRHREVDTYTLPSDDRVTIVEGARALGFRYAIREGTLLLTEPDGGAQRAYAKASDAL